MSAKSAVNDANGILAAKLDRIIQLLEDGQAPDFRGSRIEFKVDARNQDPDRVALTVMDALGRAAQRKVSSRGHPGDSGAVPAVPAEYESPAEVPRTHEPLQGSAS